MDIAVLSLESLIDHILWVLFETESHVAWTDINLLHNGGCPDPPVSTSQALRDTYCLTEPYHRLYLLLP